MTSFLTVSRAVIGAHGLNVSGTGALAECKVLVHPDAWASGGKVGKAVSHPRSVVEATSVVPVNLTVAVWALALIPTQVHQTDP